MPLYAMICIDKPNALDVRMAARPAHLEFAAALGDRLRVGGPFLDEKGDMCGSLILVEVNDLEAAKALNAVDPYTKAGLWGRVDIRAFRGTVGKP